MNILKIISSNIRKRRGAGITFLVMVLLSALMLSISLSLIIGSNNFFEKKTDEFNSPHYSNFIVTDSYKDDFTAFAENYDGVKDVCVLDTLFGMGTWKMKSGNLGVTIALSNEKELEDKSFQKFSVIDKQPMRADNAIILPINFKTSGFKSGEKITLDVNGKMYQFDIYGFYEDTLYGASTFGITVPYLSDELFQTLKADDYFTSYKNLSVRFNDSAKCTAFKTDFSKFAKLTASEEFVTTFATSKAGAMMFINLVSMLLIIFSLIILMIALIVARFSIVNAMQEDITMIGALKSIGYKTRALRLSQLLQYLFIAGIGSLIGSLISLLTFGFLGNIIASTSGLLWLSGVNIVPLLLSILVTCGLTAIITYIITRKYKKITPINALRQGDSHHSIKRNAMPLTKHKIPLNLHLGLKRFIKSLKNNITLFIVSSLLVFISCLVFTMSYNLNVDTTAMTKMVGLEMAEVWVQPAPSEDIYGIEEEIKLQTEVNRTILSGSSICYIGDLQSNVTCVEDYSKLTSNTVVEGKNPTLYNEIALCSVMARATGKKVNDTVSVEINGVINVYYVVGITQDIGNAGEYCNITLEAMLRHNGAFKMDTIYVYLNDGVNTKAYIEMLKELYGNKIMIADTDEQINSILSSLGGPFLAISIIMIVITIILIGFVLFLLISALIRKEKREFGIMKAIGYKNKHLILQILISMLPSLLLGAMFGVVLGFIITNPLLSAALSSMGLFSTFFIIPPLPTLAIGFGIFGASVLITYIISLRLKKISPQKLIVEQ